MDISDIDFDTGDILLLSCTKWYYIFSRLIEYITNCPYSHCGIIIKDPTFTPKPLQGLYFLESGKENMKDVENDRYKLGVQLVPLQEMIDNYPGKIYCRKLHCHRNKEFYDNLNQAHSDVHNISYDLNPVDWIKAMFKIDIGDNQHKTRFWCSALVVYIYIKLGLLDKNISWSLISPKELSSNYNSSLKFINCTLDNDTQIK